MTQCRGSMESTRSARDKLSTRSYMNGQILAVPMRRPLIVQKK